MTNLTLTKLFNRDLDKLKEEIELYNNEKDLWLIKNEINNSTGNLCLHLEGNLNHFIGTVLGKTGYIRQRDLELSLKDIPKNRIVEKNKKYKNYDRKCFKCFI